MNTPSECYQKIEEVLANKAIPFLLKWDGMTLAQRKMVGFPISEGGLGLIDITKGAKYQYDSSNKGTGGLQALIADMTRNISSTQCRAYNEHFVTSANEMRKGKKGRIKEDALALIASNELPPDMCRAF